MTFETTGKFLIVFVRLMLGKVGVDMGHDGKKTSDRKMISIFHQVYKGGNRLLQAFFLEI